MKAAIINILDKYTFNKLSTSNKFPNSFSTIHLLALTCQEQHPAQHSNDYLHQQHFFAELCTPVRANGSSYYILTPTHHPFASLMDQFYFFPFFSRHYLSLCICTYISGDRWRFDFNLTRHFPEPTHIHVRPSLISGSHRFHHHPAVLVACIEINRFLSPSQRCDSLVPNLSYVPAPPEGVCLFFYYCWRVAFSHTNLSRSTELTKLFLLWGMGGASFPLFPPE